MKKQNLRLCCLNRLEVLKGYFRILLQLKYMVPLLFLAACTGTPKDDGTSPAPLFPHPQSIVANPEGGYVVNPVTGDSLQPLINSLGDTVLTGVPIPAKPKVIHPDSVAQPKAVKAPAIESLEKHKAHPNRHKIPENIPAIPVDKSQLKTMPVKLAEKQPGGVLDTAHYLVNSIGDTISTGVPIPAKGKIVKAIQPKPIKALPPAIKDAAITNLQYLNVDQGMNASYVYSILEDKSGNLWFGTNSGGVNKYDGESFSHFTEKEGLSNNTVWSILEDKSGNLWFGTWGRGVSKYESAESGTSSGSFTHFTEKEGLRNNNVRSMLEDENGNLWFGTLGGGVSKYDGESFTHFTENEGLSNNRVMSILESKNNNIWLGTERGLIQIEARPEPVEGSKDGVSVPPAQKATPTVQVFGKQDGLKGLHFFANSVFLDSKNRAWWGNVNGLSMLDFNTFQLSQNPPVIYLKQLDVNEEFIDYRNISESPGKKIQFSGVEPFTNYPLNLELSYDKNHLTFYFAAIDWSAPHKIHYSYRMLGLNNNWSTPSQEAKADYRNLSYGNYTFQIRAIGESGEWSEPFEYTFTIRAPLWYSWWAYLIYGFLLLVLIRRGHIFQKARTIRKERERSQQKELEQAKEIGDAYKKLEVAHEDLKAAQYQLVQQEKLASLGQLTAGIAHEIKNPLNFVNNFSEVSIELIEEALEEIRQIEKNEHAAEVADILSDVKSNLAKVNEHGSRANSIVTSMLQHSRGGDGKMEPFPLNTLIKEYVNLAFHGMRAGKEQINVEIDLKLDENISEVPLIAEDFSRVILNLCNNAFDAMREKLRRSEVGQTSAAYLPKLTVRTRSGVDTVTIEIQDNGPGIPEEIKDKILQPFFTTKKGKQGTGLGLSITNDIVKAHGGKLEIESRIGEYTTFIVQLSLNTDDI